MSTSFEAKGKERQEVGGGRIAALEAKVLITGC